MGSLDAALVGVDRVLLVPGNDPAHRVQQHQNVVDACVRAGVELLGFASRALRDTEASRNGLMGDYLETEDRIRASGLRHVMFRNALYLDTVPLYVGGRDVLAAGRVRLPTGDGAVAYVLRRELGEAAANGMVDHAGADAVHVLAASIGVDLRRRRGGAHQGVRHDRPVGPGRGRGVPWPRPRRAACPTTSHGASSASSTTSGTASST